MSNLRIVAAVVALAMFAQVPAVALAQQGPLVSTSATQLSADELAHYGQMQADAQQKGVLDSEKGGADATTWTIVGIVAVAAIAIGLAAAIADAE